MSSVREKIYRETAGRPRKFKCERCGRLYKSYGWPVRGFNENLCIECLKEKYPLTPCLGCGEPTNYDVEYCMDCIDRRLQEDDPQRRLNEF